MRRIEKLLEGVEINWKPISKILIRTKGTKITASQMKKINKEDAPLKIFAGGKTIAFVDFEDIPEKDINREPSIIVKSRGVIEFEYYNKPFSHKNEMWSYHSKNDNINIKFVYYFLKINEPYFQNIGNRMQMPQISTPDTEKFKIPIPPIEVQKEIVRILDNFTDHTTQLKTKLSVELISRKKQHSYYRDKLLTFEAEEFEWKPLEEVGKFSYGYVAKAQNSGNARFIRISDINDDGKLKETDAKFVDVSKNNNKYILKKNDLLMARTGATYGKTMIFEEDYPAIYAGFLIKLALDNSLINPKFYWHFAQSNLFWNQASKLVSGGGQPQFNGNALKQVKIPIPFPDNPKKSLKIQTNIVNTLDKLDTLTSSIRENLPKEIELRQKQYEYYRDMLLTFPKQEIEA